MSARVFKVKNRLAASVDTRVGLRLDTALQRGQDAVHAMQDEMTPQLRGWVGEIQQLCASEAPDMARLAWLANGVLGVGGGCGMEGLARCGGLFGAAIDIMQRNGGWRRDAAAVYAAALERMLAGTDQAATQAAVLASLDAMNRSLSGDERLA